MRNWLRHLLNPVWPDETPIGTLGSPLEAKGERNALAVVERIADQPEIVALGAALNRYLADLRGMLALKKALHLVIESRARALALHIDPPEAHGLGSPPRITLIHPFDGLAAEALGISERGAGGGGAAIAAVVQAVALLVAVSRIWLLTPSRKAPPISWQVGAPAFGTARDWAPLRRALADAGWDEACAFAVVADDGYDLNPGAGTAFLRPNDCGIERSRWLCEAVLPAIRLTVAVLAQLMRKPFDPVVAITSWFALHLVRKHLAFQRLLHAARFTWYLDVAEYSAGHIIKAALLGRTGGRLVRWPHCCLDNPGATLSFLGYDQFLGTGGYEAQYYGGTWWSNCTRRSIGFFRNDRRWVRSDGQVDPAIAAAVTAQRAGGRRILAYFGPSAFPGIEPIVESALGVVLRVAVDHPDCCVVVKAKGAGAMSPISAALSVLPEARQLERDGRIIFVPYVERGAEPCPSGWLVREMAAAVGLGSVQLEALTQGKPCFSYYPVIQETPYQQLLAGCGLGHTDPRQMAEALASWLEKPAALEIPYDRFRAWFDPFADDAALTRVVDLLWDRGQTPALHSAMA